MTGSRFQSALLLLLSLVAYGSEALAGEVQIRWQGPTKNRDGSALTDLGGFKLYLGSQSGLYSQSIDVGKNESYTLLHLVPGERYYLALTAYDTSGNESDFSSERMHIVAPEPTPREGDIDGDGTPDTEDPDIDGDGLSNDEERQLGTNPRAADSDGDWVDDATEIADGTNPLDAVSATVSLGRTICADWNSFLGGMWNVFEHVNLSAHEVRVETTLFDIDGAPSSVLQFSLPPGGQFDALVHDLAGMEQNSYGRVCSRHFGQPGDLDGRMVYYRPQPETNAGAFQFAFGMQMTRGKHGSQFVPLNTMHPSLAAGEQANFVSNWLQLTNLSETTEAGSIFYYAHNGTLLLEERHVLSSGKRLDLPGHAVGASVIGMAEWRPDNPEAVFLYRNIRYLFDNPQMTESFDTAFQVEGMQGSGEELLVPVDTVLRSTVLEVMNTTGDTVGATVRLAWGDGDAERRVELAPYASEHIILDGILGPTRIGYATIEPDSPRSIAAVAMHYGRGADLGIEYMHGMQAQPAVGTRLRGSYNTHLGQDSWLLMVSPEPQQVALTLVRPDGTERYAGTQYVHGVQAVHLNAFEEPDHYGLVVVRPERPNSMIAWMLRVRGQEYVIPTPLR
ncbi:MAG: hypothetical protein KDD69_05725 [Bdellovibrionales bacterium]|nr:hypothetical protein [Bdellovibrionales bacterium]